MYRNEFISIIIIRLTHKLVSLPRLLSLKDCSVVCSVGFLMQEFELVIRKTLLSSRQLVRSLPETQLSGILSTIA